MPTALISTVSNHCCMQRSLITPTILSSGIKSIARLPNPPRLPDRYPCRSKQTPWSRNTSGFVNSSEFFQNVDPVIMLELERLYVGLHNFHKAFFGNVPDLDMVFEAIFRRCTEGNNPLFKDRWSGWLAGAKESDVLTWFVDLIPKLEAFAGDRISTPPAQRKLLADITYNPDSEDSRYRWSHILVADELKSNPKADKASIAWIDLKMRVWEFDRLGGTASEQFDINKKDGGLQFVTTILGFLWMNEDGHGFDPTIITSGAERYIEIERDGQTERLIIDEVMKRAPCVASRATICWKAHLKGDLQTPLVIKDSWQYMDHDEEGELVQEATEKGLVNVARYYRHETVRVHGVIDDIRRNVQKGLDVTKATNYRLGRLMLPSSASASNVLRKGRSSSTGMKRLSSETDAVLPSSKRSLHRRIILRDYGKPIHKASSHSALLSALERCIEGHESLRTADILHRDVSINNLMINEDNANSWPSFLVDLDLAIKEERDGASGAQGKTGKCIGPTGLDDWNYENDDKLVASKKGEIADEEDFLKKAEKHFTWYDQPLISWVNRLRRKVSPNGGRWKRLQPELYSSKKILRDARKDPGVLAEG
ncbi:kinase [Penicillium alfredii]|uniref:non-specific serine/threonine protein kinase n=1 Tax=Penicillium alfredii TaxID=1506179 RepID=A0A9W9G412_9EURO|nr:kinase [Penicillium alfredii]KAJ5111761.1 kinase [Penicillium alfredii]